MIERGDVLRLKARLGFLPKGDVGSVIVVQATPLNSILPSVLVVPLDPAAALYVNQPTAVSIPAKEAGTASSQVAIVSQVRPLRLDHAAPGVAGRLSPATLARIDQILRLVLDLP
jgi:mRNA-degrading endonuclease toxin of MazEF toxin-antitoxin module